MATQKAHGGGKRSFRSNRKGIVGHDFFYRVALGEFIDLFRARDQHARGIGVPMARAVTIPPRVSLSSTGNLLIPCFAISCLAMAVMLKGSTASTPPVIQT